jgi:hypothetical protein
LTKAEKAYLRFHGQKVNQTFETIFTTPRKLVHLGDAVAIIYRSDKKNGGGNGTPRLFKHDFKPGVILAMDETAKNQLYIIGESLKVTSAGIEG